MKQVPFGSSYISVSASSSSTFGFFLCFLYSQHVLLPTFERYIPIDSIIRQSQTSTFRVPATIEISIFILFLHLHISYERPLVKGQRLALQNK